MVITNRLPFWWLRAKAICVPSGDQDGCSSWTVVPEVLVPNGAVNWIGSEPSASMIHRRVRVTVPPGIWRLLTKTIRVASGDQSGEYSSIAPLSVSSTLSWPSGANTTMSGCWPPVLAAIRRPTGDQLGSR